MTFDHQKYWTDRHRRQGQTYVARGGRRSEYEREYKAVAPFLTRAIAGARTVLDFGCGTQRFRVPLESGGAKYFGVDQVPGLGTLPIHDLVGRQFDAIVCSFVLQHVPDDDMLAQLVRCFYMWLSPGGRLIVVNHDGLVAKPDAHMASRTQDSLNIIAKHAGFAWNQEVGRYQTHWMGWFQKLGDEVMWPTLPPEPVLADPAKADEQYVSQFQRPAQKGPVVLNTTLVAMSSQLALVLGGGYCVWEDVDRFMTDFWGEDRWPGLVIAVNDVGCHIASRVDHWASLHPEKLPKWREARSQHTPGLVPSWSRTTHTTHKLRPWGGGSSGLYGVQVAVEALKCTHVILCGVPMTKTPHFAESQVHQANKVWANAQGHFRPWKDQRKRYEKVTRSMSGQTRELLGAPTLDWLSTCRVSP